MAIVGGISIGYRFGQGKDNTKYCTTSMIAVVNQDEGVMVDGEMINYAGSLGEFPNTNYIYTGLEEARQGMQSNRFAGYIIIPPAFSLAVDSINTQPEQAKISYQLNPMLDDGLKMEVFYDVITYIQTMNDNISYLYVDAILEEFHQAQNNAATIIKSDDEAVSYISGIDEESIVSELPASERKYVETTLEDVVLDEEYKAAEAAVDEIDRQYTQGMEKAGEELAQLEKDKEGVGKNIEEFITYTGSINIVQNADGTVLYEEGVKQLGELVQQHQESVLTANQTINECINKSTVSDNSVPSLDESQGIQQQLEWMKEKNDEIVRELQRLTSEFQKPGVTISGSLSQNAVVASLDNMGVKASKTADAIGYAKTKLVNLQDTFRDYPVLDAGAAGTIVQEQIAAPVMNRINEEQKAIQTKNTDMSKVLSDYTQKMERFNALDHIDQDEVSRQLTSLSEAVYKMEEQTAKSMESYADYADEVYKLTDETLTNMETDINESYEATKENIFSMVQEVKESNIDWSMESTELMNDFTKKLPYSRSGSLGNRQMYEFAINPIDVSGSYSMVGLTRQSRSIMSFNRMFIVIIALEGILLIYFIAAHFLRDKMIKVSYETTTE